MIQRIISVLIVDDHALFREGIAALIASQSDMTVSGEASNGREAVERFRSAPADVTLMDLRMPGLSGIEAIVAIRAARILPPATRRRDRHPSMGFRRR